MQLLILFSYLASDMGKLEDVLNSGEIMRYESCLPGLKDSAGRMALWKSPDKHNTCTSKHPLYEIHITMWSLHEYVLHNATYSHKYLPTSESPLDHNMSSYLQLFSSIFFQLYQFLKYINKNKTFNVLFCPHLKWLMATAIEKDCHQAFPYTNRIERSLLL